MISGDFSLSRHLSDAGDPPFQAIITSNVGGVYGYYEVQDEANGTYSINLQKRFGTQSFEPAYEETGNVDVPIGTIVTMRRGFLGGNTTIPNYVKQDWRFFYPDPAATPSSTNLYAQLTNVTTSGGYLFYDWTEQVMLSNGAWSNGSITGTENAREFNNNNITIGSYVHLFESYFSGEYVNVAYQQIGNGTVSTIQTVEVQATGGTFTLMFNNGTASATTGGIAFNASIAAVETALEALSNIGNCTVTGAESDYTVEFNDSFSFYPLMTATSYLTGDTLYVFNKDVSNATTPAAPNLSLQFNNASVFGGLANTTANLTYGVPAYGGMTALTLLALDGSNVTMPVAIGTNLTLSGANRTYTLNASGANATFDNTTLTGTTTVNGTLQINVTNETYNGNITKLYNGTYTNETYAGDVYETYNGNLSKTVAANKTYALDANTTLPVGKKLTLPLIVGNDAGGKLRITSSPTANAALPTAIRLDNTTLEVTGITGTPPTPSSGDYGFFVDGNGTAMLVDSGGTTYPIANTGNGTSNGSQGWVQYADGSGGFSAASTITIDAANNTLAADTLRSATLASGPFMVYADPDGDLTTVTAITSQRVMFADANGLPTGDADLTFNSTTNTLYAGALRVGSGGGGDVVTYLDNNGTLQTIANPGAGNFTLHCVNGTLGWF